MFVSHPRSGPRIVQANRRTAVRVAADGLPWLRLARLSHGPELALIDLSLRGAQFEVAHRLRAGDRAELELIDDRERTLSIARVVRSEVAEVQPDAVRYRSACVFAAPLPWTARFPATTLAPAALREQFAHQPWGGWSDVMVQFRHGGRSLRGYVRQFEPSQACVDVWPSRTASAAEKQSVPLALVRAVHVLSDIADGELRPRLHESPRGTPVEVVFKNAQLLRGTLPSYDPDAIGFWLFPPRGVAWRRVLAITAAVAEIRLLYPDDDDANSGATFSDSRLTYRAPLTI